MTRLRCGCEVTGREAWKPLGPMAMAHGLLIYCDEDGCKERADCFTVGEHSSGRQCFHYLCKWCLEALRKVDA